MTTVEEYRDIVAYQRGHVKQNEGIARIRGGAGLPMRGNRTKGDWSGLVNASTGLNLAISASACHNQCV